MACCNATTATVPSIGTPDPGQHVNFVKGMVLGVADYVQEHAYLAGRSEWMARDLIGYGTASGLAVRTEDDGTNGPRIHISAGSAVAPSGKMICVGREQCGSIQGWLGDKANGAKVAARTSGSPPSSSITLYLTLCYRDCAIAPIPVPGEPCRSDEDLMQPSRTADDYCLDFRLDPPEQWEADAIGTFSMWLDEIADDGPASPPLGPDQWTDEIRAALDAITGDFLDGSPPVASPPLVPPLPPGVSTDDYDDFLRLAYRLWITEYRPKVMAQRCGDADARANDCILLAALDVPLAHTGRDPETGWSVDAAGDIRIDERRRPLIAPLHLVQTALGIMSEGGGWLTPPPGPAGPQGLTGATGAAGEAGSAGAAGGAGATGATGPQGLTGSQGPAGAVGAAGAAGVAGPAGATGPQGPEGPQGPAGPGGAGSVGPAGPVGPAGAAGAAGLIGSAGPAGPVGPIGPTGLRGLTGATGQNGATGATGPGGTTGPFTLRTTVVSATADVTDDFDVYLAVGATAITLPPVGTTENGRSIYIKALDAPVVVESNELIEQFALTANGVRFSQKLSFGPARSIQLVFARELGQWLIVADYNSVRAG